ncbi:hypothetical protein KIPB_010699, partial [Kipferlia bialata]
LMHNLTFDPLDSLTCIESGSKILLRVSAADIIPLPRGTKGLTLTMKRQYRQAEVANDLVRDLHDIVGPVIDRQNDLLGFSKRLTTLGIGSQQSDTSDLEAWGVLDTMGSATLTLVSNLSVAQGKARTLLGRLEGEGEEVSVRQIEDAEDDRDEVAQKLKRRNLTEQKKLSLREKLAVLEAKIVTLKEARVSHSDLVAQLRPYLIFPEVAEALGEHLRERVIDHSSAFQHPCDWGQGYIVTENGLEEGEIKLVNTYAVVDMIDRELTSQDFQDQDVTLWDLSGRVTGCDLTAVEGLTVEQMSSLASLTQCTLRGMDLTGLDLTDTDVSGSNLSGANLSECDMTRATLTGCDLSRATLTGVTGLTLEHLQGASSVKGVVVSGVDMCGWDMQ